MFDIELFSKTLKVTWDKKISIKKITANGKSSLTWN